MPPLPDLFAFFRAGKDRSPPSPVDEQEREHAARDQAQAAVARLDLPAALAILQEWETRATQPMTLALLGHVLKTTGKPERARALLEGALLTHRDDPALLETLAQLYEYTQDAAGEYRCRKQRMMLAGCEMAHVIDTMRALVALKSAGGPPVAELRLVRAMFAQRETIARRDECLRFAELLYNIEAAQDDAIRLVARHLPAPQGMQDRTFTRAGIASVSPQAGELRTAGSGQQTAQLLTMNNAWVLAGLHWSPCIPDTGQVLDVFQTVRPVLARDRASSPLLLRSASQMRLRLKSGEPQVVQDPCVLLGGGAATNYYHFMHEHLSRLAVLDELGVDRSGMRYAVGSGLQPYQRELLGLLGIGEERLVEMPDDGVLAFATLLAPLPLGRGGNFTSPLMARWARNRLVQACGARQGGGRKLFLSRARTSRRRIVNEAEVFEVCAAYGYELIYPEELGAREQVALFSQATHIAGSGGAALTNMLFMPPGGQVLLMNNLYMPPQVRNMYFEPLSRACGHSFSVLSGEPAAFPTDRAIDADVHIDVSALRALLDKR